MCPSAPISVAEWIRARSWRWPPAHLGRVRTFTGGFDLSSASGLELGFDERAASEMLANRFKTEHYEVVLHAGDMEHVLPELVWHLEDLRVGQCYPNYYVARLGGRFCEGRAVRRRRRRAVRRLSLALLPGDSRQQPRGLLPGVLQLLAAPGSRRRSIVLLHAGHVGRGATPRAVRSVPRRLRRGTSPRSTRRKISSTPRCISRPGRSSTACSSSKTS